MITIDGSAGEGGGQILRTALALSLVTGKPFTIKNIRAKRKKPGLMKQHLTAVNAAIDIGKASARGNHRGSQILEFSPHGVKAGKYHFTVGSAGSCTLVLQAILPALVLTREPSEILLEGGTHNPMAPPFDFVNKTLLPLLNRMGSKVSISLEKYGFYPAGGGRIRVFIKPALKLGGFDLLTRGKLNKITARALVSRLPLTIAQREINVAGDHLGIARHAREAIDVREADGPGNVLFIEVGFENVTEVFTSFGQRGIRAEEVAKKVVKQVKAYLTSEAAAGIHLADQLLLPLALAGGGKFSTLTPSEHTKTNAGIIKNFLDVTITMREQAENLWEIQVISLP